MYKPKILVVEDDPAITNLMRTTQEYQYHTARTGSGALLDAVSYNPDVIILDLGLPDMDGVDIIRKIRGWSEMPIIVVSARSEDQDKVEALDERNIQVELRARSRTLSLLRGTLMAVLILSLIGALANPKGELVYGGMMVVSGVLYTLSLFIELACSFYYEGRI